MGGGTYKFINSWNILRLQRRALSIELKLFFSNPFSENFMEGLALLKELHCDVEIINMFCINVALTLEYLVGFLCIGLDSLSEKSQDKIRPTLPNA